MNKFNMNGSYMISAKNKKTAQSFFKEMFGLVCVEYLSHLLKIKFENIKMKVSDILLLQNPSEYSTDPDIKEYEVIFSIEGTSKTPEQKLINFFSEDYYKLEKIISTGLDISVNNFDIWPEGG